MPIRALLVALLAVAARGAAQPLDTITMRHRVMIASTIYHQIKTYFPDLNESQFERDYDAYVGEILGGSDDRRGFDLATMALVASLHDGHTWFYDHWLDETYGQPTGLTVYHRGGEWVVVRSQIASIRTGDVVTAVDGTPIDAFFQAHQKYVSGSSERDASTSFFDTPALFPERFTATLGDGRQVTIDRAHDTRPAVPPPVEGRWLVPTTVGYVRVAAFQGIETVADAWHWFKQFHDAKTVILDLRGNIGGGDPRALQAALMAKPYPMWSEQAAMSGGALLRGYGVAHPGMEHVRISDSDMRSRGPTFAGRLIILIDRGCSCACEDFTMPFKVTGRAQLLGETTAGTFAFTNSTQFDNGMRVNIAAIRHTFPDGSRFEGVGIVPDVAVEPTAQDLRDGRDLVLERGLALARS